jgi:galactoside O-acetyltransferase
VKKYLSCRFLRLKRLVSLSLSLIFWLELVYTAFMKMRLKRCGKRTFLKLNTVVMGHENIVLGDYLNLMNFVYLYADNDGYLEIGNNCSVNNNVQLAAAGGRLIIGDNVMIASNVVIRSANHGMKKDAAMRFQPHIYGEIIIEDDVWIGANSVITSGVILSKGTVVGAGAVVTRSTEPYSIVGGVPARKISERI